MCIFSFSTVSGFTVVRKYDTKVSGIAGFGVRLNNEDLDVVSGVFDLATSADFLSRDFDRPRGFALSAFCLFVGESPLLNVNVLLLGLLFFGLSVSSTFLVVSASTKHVPWSVFDLCAIAGLPVDGASTAAEARLSMLETEPKTVLFFFTKSALISIVKDLILSRRFCGMFLVS